MSRSKPPARRAKRTGRARLAVRDHLARLQRCARAVPPAEVAAVAEHLWAVIRSEGQVLIAGNGGSAATASHMALDLGKTTLGHRPPPDTMRVRALALSDHGAVLTAWANDGGYERVYAEQITALARRGDAVVLISVSGNSPNIVAAAHAARKARASVIALLGRPGGALRVLADLAIVVPSEDYGIVEDMHLVINHIVTRYLRAAIEAAASPRRGHPRVDVAGRMIGTPQVRARPRRARSGAGTGR
jgi:D-sedoheptulose 7-phosphate isomerase